MRSLLFISMLSVLLSSTGYSREIFSDKEGLLYQVLGEAKLSKGLAATFAAGGMRVDKNTLQPTDLCVQYGTTFFQSRITKALFIYNVPCNTANLWDHIVQTFIIEESKSGKEDPETQAPLLSASIYDKNPDEMYDSASIAYLKDASIPYIYDICSIKPALNNCDIDIKDGQLISIVYKEKPSFESDPLEQ